MGEGQYKFKWPMEPTHGEEWEDFRQQARAQPGERERSAESAQVCIEDEEGRSVSVVCLYVYVVFAQRVL